MNFKILIGQTLDFKILVKFKSFESQNSEFKILTDFKIFENQNPKIQDVDRLQDLLKPIFWNQEFAWPQDFKEPKS